MDLPFARDAAVSIQTYIRGETENIFRLRRFLELLMQRGRISYNWGGTGVEKTIRYRRSQIRGYADTDTVVFNRVDKWKRASMPYRGYTAVDSCTQIEIEQNKGNEQIVRLYGGMAERIKDDIRDQFHDEVYVNGYAAGNQKRLLGTESWASGGTAQAGGKFATPTITSYLGLSTVPGAYGGTAPTGGTWPNGTGQSSDYDFWSPILVDTTNTGWTAATKTWPNTCLECLRAGLIKARKSPGKVGKVDLVTMEEQLWSDFMNRYEGQQRLNIMRPSGQAAGTLNVGFDNMNATFDGAEIYWEYGVPANTAYGYNAEHIELMGMQDELFKLYGPQFNLADLSHRFLVLFLGNFFFNPRAQVKFYPYTS